ncbi:MAG: matrixin family metalloprotease [Chloroflexi bacterium]|nr:matrixin family metalloprotease [Chloroflexota bacterium]
MFPATSQAAFHIQASLVGVTLILLLMGALTVGAQEALPMVRYAEPYEGALAAGASVSVQFTAEEGDRLIIVANAKGGEIDPFVQLFTREGALLGEEDDGGGKRNARLEDITAPASGPYVVTVTNLASGGSGNFALIVNNEALVIAYHGGGVDSPFSADPGYVGYQLSEPWQTTDLTYYLANVVEGFEEGEVEQVMVEAFAAWAQNTPLTFTRVFDQNADIIVSFASIDGSSQVLGQACPPSSPCAGSVEFDVDENWTLYEPQGYNSISLIGVATHEFGHVVGLLHSSDPSALMYAQYSPYNLQPSSDDIAGVQRLYGAGQGGVIGAPTSAPGGGQDEGNAVIGTISDAQYVEWWDFDVVSGEYVTITMEALNGGLDPLLIIVDAANQVIAYDDDSAGELNAVVRNIRFPQDGTYSVAATRFEQAQGYTEGQYQLTLDFGFTDAPAGGSTGGSTAQTPAPAGGGTVNLVPGELADFPNLLTVLNGSFADSVTPVVQRKTGTVSAGQNYTWSFTWCATSTANLERGLESMRVDFAIEGAPVPENDIIVVRQEGNGLFCAEYGLVLGEWSGGSVRLTTTMHLERPVFDGLNIYQPGDYVNEIVLAIMS